MSPRTVILSPHFDDAVLSCWHLLASADEVLVVNVFAGEPPAGTLGWWDRLAGATDSAAAVRTRIEEDRQALALAGRTAVNLPFLDSQYRQRRPGDGRDRRGAARSARRGRPDIRAGQSGRPPSRPHRGACGGAGAPRRGCRRGAVRRPASRRPCIGWPRWVLDGRSSYGCGSGERAMGDPARSHRHPGRADGRPRCTGCRPRTMPASSRPCSPTAVR